MICYSAFTDKGNREINEDSIGVFQNGENYCFVLCDGLGGHGMGDVASGYVKDSFETLFANTFDTKDFLDQAFFISQSGLLEEQKKRNATSKMKTTCVSVVTDDKYAYIGHIGDSRIYLFHHNRVKLRTLDHSIPQMLVLSKEIKESEIRNHPQRNMLLRVMGIEWDKKMFDLMNPIPLRKCQAFLLCSDGFWELIEESKMCELLKKAETPDEWLQNMVEEVKRNGSDRNMDNFSAIAIWNE